MATFHEFTQGQTVRVTPTGEPTIEVTVRGTHEDGITAWAAGAEGTFAENDAAGVRTFHFQGVEKNADLEA
jgi:hypothetical protein